jgi:maleate isomerase
VYGWRARLGVMIPSVNSVIEPEFAHLSSLTPGVSSYFSRMIMKGQSKFEQLESMVESIDECVESLLDVSDVLLYGCTSGSFLKGPAWDNTITEHIKSVAIGKEVITTSNALVQALRELMVQTIVLATPYIEEVNEKQVSYFRKSGFTVASVLGLSITTRGGAGLCTPDEAYRLARKVAQGQSADAIVISCTNFRTLGAINLLENDLGIPVVTSNQALFWAGLRRTGISSPIYGYGSLLESS